MSKTRILLADDQADLIGALGLLLKPEGFEIETASNSGQILDKVKQHDFDVVLMDMNYVRGETSGQQGLDCLYAIAQIDELLPVVVMTAWSSVELAVEAMRRGASDFVSKPWDNERLLSILRTQADLGRARRKARQLAQEVHDLQTGAGHEMIAESEAMRPVLETIARVGPSDANVLITGENGTGKGLVARALHAASQRQSESLVTVNTASIPETLFESELFGHVAGAFTDARTTRLGRFQLADEGTLFLDEIATVPIQLQPKLLRVLESGEFESMGSSKTCRVDVRVISATNADLQTEIEAGRFRQDLLYRLNTVHLHLPPLRERRSDIPILAEFFLRRHSQRYRKDPPRLAPGLTQALCDYNWPGNVRELDHALERAVLMAPGDQVRLSDLGLSPKSSSPPNLESMTLDELEQWALKKALARYPDLTQAAEALGLSRGALYRRLEKYDIRDR